MFNFKKRKQQRQYIEGLSLLESGLKVQLEQAKWHLGFDDLTKEEQTRWETLKKHCEYVLNEINDIWSGKLHY